MKSKFIGLLVVFIIAGMSQALAQKEKDKDKQKTETIVLVCPFEHGSGREPKEAYTWDPPDQKVIMISHIDSVIRSAVTGEVLKVTSTEDDKYEVVIAYKNYYFWYYNVSRPLVNERQTVKAGQSIGIYKFGDELEFRMFKEARDTEPQMMDPRNLLECKVEKAE